MSKSKFNSNFDTSSARACAKMLRVSPRKLNLVLQFIRGKLASSALKDLSFAPQRIARDVSKVLMSAIANAENNYGLDVDRLIVVEATVGKSLVMKRTDIRGRSKVGRIKKPFSNMRIVVREQKE